MFWIVLFVMLVSIWLFALVGSNIGCWFYKLIWFLYEASVTEKIEKKEGIF